ncbi:quinon protein alcohol dehydrogenase-like superfamily [Neohortaea acidophila]|uniref:Quinon protein alcohol dehydrogenase-like superfamily n=1 Tax=Neohortaea acidophila TaxID=245834 RepID=A0A6A6Q474_9PEZI|nr:quinon protein alcohol dehydrogenase-like superfamily [Neohortaea acidophila]KAF2486756.1 quinon protein alcohol dehydrogenase-like superfamily [Neohortaea acidophila]
MPPDRPISAKQTSKRIQSTDRPFVFPNNCHLLITTRNCIYARDAAGTNTVFRSSKHGIVAAREAQDESGILAVADKHVVVLHDTKRGSEKSWGLDASEDEVRHLEYSHSASSLYLCTSLTSDIQRYSIKQSRLLSPTRTHASPPVALAISPTERLMVSASDGPPVVYLRDLLQNGPPILIEPRVSKAAVSVAAFHPEKPNIFLLAFRDGSIAEYDASRVLRSATGCLSDQENVNKGELSHLTALHRAASADKKGAITGAAFLPGFTTRAVTAGRDGKCRIIDFADGGVVLRTWHVRAPVTSISVLFPAPPEPSRDRGVGRPKPHMPRPSVGTDSLLAIGREDGELYIYDSLGLLLDQYKLTELGVKIISVEWVKGPSPKPVSSIDAGEVVQAVPCDQPADSQLQKASIMLEKAESSRNGAPVEYLGPPPSLRKPATASPHRKASGSSRKFTIHPDEVEDDTVRHTPLPKITGPVLVQKGDYLDLFSPVKPPEPKAASEQRLSSPPRSRPSITSQTFVKSPEAVTAAVDDTLVRRRNLELFPSTDSGPAPNKSPVEGSTAAKRSSFNNSPFAEPNRRLTFKAQSIRQRRRSSGLRKPTLDPPNGNAKLLADLRKMSTSQKTGQPGGVLSSMSIANASSDAKASTRPSGKKENKSRFLHRSTDHIEIEADSETARKAYDEVRKKQHWPEDSTQASSLDNDIWFTSDSGEDEHQTARRKRATAQRPPARQTSRSRVTSKGTLSTLGVPHAEHSQAYRMDGSTEEEMFTAAEAPITSSGAFSPSSQHVRELFPRSSSLSPRKHHRSKKYGLSQQNPKTTSQPLSEIAPNQIAGRQVKSPWARAKANQAVHGSRIDSTARRAVPSSNACKAAIPPIDGQKENANESHCNICSPTKAKLLEVEAEVARLRAEVLMLKTVLRRQGLPVPQTVRRGEKRAARGL